MEIYHTATQEDYDALMIDLEAEGYRWAGGKKPTELSLFDKYGSETTVVAYDGIFEKTMKYGDVAYEIENNPNVQIIEYKAKGDNMNKKQFKQQSHDLLVDMASTIGAFTTNLELTDYDLAKTRELVKKFDETLTEFIDSRKPEFKPEFKSGDIVASQVLSDGNFSFVRLNEDLTNRHTRIDGFWYIKSDCEVYEVSLEVFKEDTRHATPEEIAEYKAALNFHKHGRNPFELKEGDMILADDGYRFFVEDPDIWVKEDFVSGRYTLLKTVEELEAWLSDGQ